jgi:hypothetical protein
MNLHKSYIVLGLIIAFALIFGIIARADEANDQVNVTSNKAVQIHGTGIAPEVYPFQIVLQNKY